MKVTVLGGGNSSERDVSLRSAAAVAGGLKEAGFSVIEADPKNGLNFLDQNLTDNIIFPILHGKGGEDGTIQKELEKRRLPYLGTNSESSKVCFDKWLTRLALQSANLPIAKGDKITFEKYLQHKLTLNPHVLKIVDGGSSIGTYIARNPKKINMELVNEVFELGSEAVIEEFVEGVEITVSIFDSNALPVIEIKPPKNQEFNYENKYNGNTQEFCPPVSVSSEDQIKAQRLAVKVHSVLNCRHLSRTDMIVRKNGDIVILETNTMPGMTNNSLYPTAAGAADMSMPVLMKAFVDLVKRDYEVKD